MSKKIKLGDWLVLKNNGMLVQANLNDVKYSETTLDQADFWEPKDGDWVIPKFQSGDSFSVIRWKDSYKGTSYELCEPYLGNLPECIS